MLKRIIVSGLAVAALVTGPALAAGAAAPPPVTCGSYLETDAYLTEDLHCPDGTGIYLAIDVTLDLRGHRLIGPGATSSKGAGIGVTPSPAWPSRIVNGTIRDWPIGIGGNEDFETVEQATLQNLKLVNNGTAILANQTQFTLHDLTVKGNTTGLYAHSWGEVGAQFILTGSSFHDNDVAVVVDPRTVAIVKGNTFSGNGVGYTVEAGDADGYDVTLRANVFTDNGDAVNVATPPGTALGDNIVLRNSGWGIYAPGADDLGGNIARRNGKSPQCVGVVCNRS